MSASAEAALLTKRTVELTRHRTSKHGVTFSDEGCEGVAGSAFAEYYFMDITTYAEMGRPNSVRITVEPANG